MAVRLAQLDTAATAADPDGAGVATSGYDPEFREPIRVSAGEGPGTDARAETLTDFLSAQVEVAKWDERRQAYTGNLPAGSVILIFHFAELETLGLVDANGEARIRVGDRLEGIYDPTTFDLIQRPTTPLYAVQPQPGSFGLDGLQRNLLILGFAPRDAGALTPP